MWHLVLAEAYVFCPRCIYGFTDSVVVSFLPLCGGDWSDKTTLGHVGGVLMCEQKVGSFFLDLSFLVWWFAQSKAILNCVSHVNVQRSFNCTYNKLAEEIPLASMRGSKCYKESNMSNIINAWRRHLCALLTLCFRTSLMCITMYHHFT